MFASTNNIFQTLLLTARALIRGLARGDVYMLRKGNRGQNYIYFWRRGSMTIFEQWIN